MDTFLEAMWGLENASWRRLGCLSGGPCGSELVPKRPKMGAKRSPNWLQDAKLDQEHVTAPLQVARVHDHHPFFTLRKSPRDVKKTPRHRQKTAQKTKKTTEIRKTKPQNDDPLRNAKMIVQRAGTRNGPGNAEPKWSLGEIELVKYSKPPKL